MALKILYNTEQSNNNLILDYKSDTGELVLKYQFPIIECNYYSFDYCFDFPFYSEFDYEFDFNLA